MCKNKEQYDYFIILDENRVFLRYVKGNCYDHWEEVQQHAPCYVQQHSKDGTDCNLIHVEKNDKK